MNCFLRVAMAAAAAAVCLMAQATIEIDAAKPASYQIPRSIYGTFLEPIGNAIYGGLWAQILENPSFEENLWSADAIRRRVEREPGLARGSRRGLPLPWEPLDDAQGARYEPRWGDAANSSRSVLIMALPGKQTGVRQEVYLPVHRVLRYTGSIWFKHVSGPAEAEVSLRLRNRPETVIATAKLPLSGAAWKRYEFSLEVPPGKLARLEPSDFVIALANETRAWVDQVFLFPADHVDGMEPEMVAMCREMKSPLVRFGGNFTSAYHWRDGVGPMDQRVSMLNISWNIPEYNHFGTDELLNFCRRTNAEPQIALNLGSGTPDEAAEWVRYVNGKWGKGGLLWELGNELWGDFQTGYPTLARVAERTRAFSDAVRRVDPEARLIATGQDPDHFREWNAAQLALPPGTFQFLSTHFVVGSGNTVRRNPGPDFTALAAFALPVGLERKLREMNDQLVGRAKLAFTEWLFHGPDEVPRFSNMGGAICTAGFLNTLMRVGDFTPVSDMTGNIEFGGIWKKRSQVYGVPAYWAFRMYSNADAVTPVATRTTVESYDVTEGVTRIPEIKDVPFLDVVAATNAGSTKLTLFCVNRHLHRDLTAKVQVAGFVPQGEARIQTLASQSIYDANDDLRPNAVRPVERRQKLGASFEHTFPRSSVTVIEMTH